MTRASLREYAAVQRERYRTVSRTGEAPAVGRGRRRHRDASQGRHPAAAPRAAARDGTPRARPAARVRTGRRWRRPRPRSLAGDGAHRRASPAPLRAGTARAAHPVRGTHAAPAVDKLLRQASRPHPRPPVRARPRAVPPARGDHHAPGTWLKHQIPIRTFTEWDDARPGFVRSTWWPTAAAAPRASTSAPSAPSISPSCWVELHAVWGKGQSRVGGAIHRVGSVLPVPLVGLDSDNGSEFINHAPLYWCQPHAVTFTRSRAWKKNDSAHVEQKNGAVVRHLVGYDRFASQAAYAQLTRVYAARPLACELLPTRQKLVAKPREAPASQRFYDRAQTPYQRLCAAGSCRPPPTPNWRRLYQRLNPLQLRRDLEAALERLWTLAAPDPNRAQGNTEIATPSLKSAPGGS